MRSVNSPSRRLRELIATSRTIVAPGVYDGLTAALVREAGFDAAYMSGAAVAASAVGFPDIGLATLTEMVGQAVVINRQVGVPLIADADTGFGAVANTVRTVAEYERAGVAAIQLEDQVFPKRCGHLDRKEVIDADEFADKIRAAAQVRSTDTVIIARTDALATKGFDEALTRAELYVDAGADMIFIEAPQTVEQIAATPGNVSAPAIFNLVPSGKTPPVSLRQLEQWGYRLVIAPAACLAPAAASIRAGLRRLSSGDIATDGQDSPAALFAALGLASWLDLDSATVAEVAEHV